MKITDSGNGASKKRNHIFWYHVLMGSVHAKCTPISVGNEMQGKLGQNT